MDKEQKTEQASAKQRRKFREDGKVATSRDVTAVAMLVITGATLFVVIPRAGHAFEALARFCFGKLHSSQKLPLEKYGADMLATLLTSIGPVAAVAMVTALLVGLGQTRGLFSVKALKPDLNRLNPIPKLRQLFASKQTLTSLGMSLARVGVIGAFAVEALHHELPTLISLAYRQHTAIGEVLLGGIFRLGIRVASVMAVIAAVDYWINRRRIEQDMKMTKQQVRDEHKDQEGSPEVRRRQRGRQRELGRNRMLAAVADADVVVVNPTHYAVALKYQVASMSAPQVTALGVDEVALRIRTHARDNGVPIIHNPPLARALYAECPVDAEVTPGLYAAVAEVLALVYRMGAAR